jgi:hypothetical protein
MSLIIAVVPTPLWLTGWKIISLITTTGGRYYYPPFTRGNRHTGRSGLHQGQKKKKYDLYLAP